MPLTSDTSPCEHFISVQLVKPSASKAKAKNFIQIYIQFLYYSLHLYLILNANHAFKNKMRGWYFNFYCSHSKHIKKYVAISIFIIKIGLPIL